MKHQHEESVFKAVKKTRLKLEPCHAFHSKGCEDRFLHQEKLKAKFEAANDTVISGRTEDAMQALKEGMEIISVRKKACFAIRQARLGFRFRI